MRFLFATIHHPEAEFYGRVAKRLEARGHEVAQVSFSRHGVRLLEKGGVTAYCLPDRMKSLAPFDRDAEVERLERTYDTPSLRDIYKTDPPCYGRSEEWSLDRTIGHFQALEQICDEWRPDVIVPEVGSETIRTALHLVGLERGITVLFLFYTIFPNPLRLYANTMHAPIAPAEDVRDLAPEERAEVESFIAQFTELRKPIRPYRNTAVTLHAIRSFAANLAIRLTGDRDNDYMTLLRHGVVRRVERVRGRIARLLYERPREGRPFVYFPLHVTDDYKIKRVIPHCVDQASIIEQIASALPQGYDVVLKEHPMSIGRNRLRLLWRLRRIPNARLLEPYTNSHDLMQAAEAIAVISSTVGLEALMYGKPVLTVGQPFYGGYGVTLDVDSFREIHTKVPELLHFRPDREEILRFLHAAMRRCYPGAPYLVDPSDENAEQLASSLDDAARNPVQQAPAVPAAV